MSEQELRDAYRLAANTPSTGDGKDVTAQLAFKKVLAAHLQPEYDGVHYELLRERANTRLWQLTRSEFAKRPNAEAFLLSKVPLEKDQETQADIIQILGHLRSRHAAELSRDFLEHDIGRHREVALFVLGWVGDHSDIQRLGRHLLGEPAPRLRITAASALRQMAWRRPELKSEILRVLKAGIEQESSDEVLPWIIIMIGTIAAKNLGLRESKEHPDQWIGDLQKARKRAAMFLSNV